MTTSSNARLVRTARKTKAMIFIPGKGAFSGAVDVYRDGPKVVVVGEGAATHASPHGPITMKGRFAIAFPNVQGYNWAKQKAALKDPEKYAQLVGLLGVDDDATHAPPLPQILFGDPRTVPNETLPMLPVVAMGAGTAEAVPAFVDTVAIVDDDTAATFDPANPHDGTPAFADLLVED